MSHEAVAYIKALKICPDGRSTLSMPERLIAYLLADYYQDLEGSFPSIQTLAEESGTDRRRCQRLIVALETKRVIVSCRPESQGRGHLTCFKFPGFEKGGTSDTKGGIKGGTKGGKSGFVLSDEQEQEHISPPAPSEPPAELVLAAKNPEPKTDSRWKPCLQILADYWKAKNPALPFPFGKPGGEQLKKFLLNNPELSPKQFAGLVRNRFLSEENHGEPAHLWLFDAMKYALSPLDKFGNPLAGFSPPKPKRVYVNDNKPVEITSGARNAISRA